jgi:hypothetical protein
MQDNEQWVQQTQPPRRIDASPAPAGKVERPRPLGAPPQRPRYPGPASADDAANFIGTMP